MLKTNHQDQYSNLISNIGELLDTARKKAYQQVNTILVTTYREIGKYIVEYEQGGKKKADYGDRLLKKLAKDLKSEFGRGFSWRNLYYMKLLYTTYPKLQTLSAKFQKLNRSHSDGKSCLARLRTIKKWSQ